jgi:hypothetical protein
MKLTLADAKIYLRVDSADEDEAVIKPIIATAKQLVKDVARSKTDFFDADEAETDTTEDIPVVKAATYHAIAYLYEHRETADMNALTLQLRSMLFGVREAAF